MNKEKRLFDSTVKSERLYLPHKTKIPANFIANFLIDKDSKLDLFRKNRFQTNQRFEDVFKLQNEIDSCFKNGNGNLDLTFDQACILLGIATLYTKYNPYDELVCLKSELFRAAGYDSPSGGQRHKLNMALDKLAEEKYPIYWAQRDEYRNRSRWITYDTLINMTTGMEKISTCKSIVASPPKINNVRLKITFNKRLEGDWDEGFRLSETSICKEIREYKIRSGKYPSKFDIRFYYLLLGENKICIKRNYLKIAKNPMGMYHFIKEGKFRYIREKLNSIYEMYNDLGYLQSYELNKKGSKNMFDVFYLNPERFYQLQGMKRG